MFGNFSSEFWLNFLAFTLKMSNTGNFRVINGLNKITNKSETGINIPKEIDHHTLFVL